MSTQSMLLDLWLVCADLRDAARTANVEVLQRLMKLNVDPCAQVPRVFDPVDMLYMFDTQARGDRQIEKSMRTETEPRALC